VALGALAVTQQHKIKRLQATKAAEAQAGWTDLKQLNRFVADLRGQYENAVADTVWAQQRLLRKGVLFLELQTQYGRVIRLPLSYAASFFERDSRKSGA
jgi:hypothetical protein